MIYLDTHAAAWIYFGSLEEFSSEGRRLIDHAELALSPFVLLELQYLFEIKKINTLPNKILTVLTTELGVSMRNVELISLIEQAVRFSWTRDPFDRLLVAQAAVENSKFLSRDRNIRNNFKAAIW